MKFCLNVTSMPLRSITRRQPDLLIWFDGLSQDEQTLRQKMQSQSNGGSGGVLLAIFQQDYFSAMNRRKISLTEVAELTQLLRETGLPRRQPHLEEAIDTSECSVQIYLAGEIEQQPFSVELHIMSSSFVGRDARAFAAFCRYLLWLANLRHKGGSPGYLNEKLWGTLTGPLNQEAKSR